MVFDLAKFTDKCNYTFKNEISAFNDNEKVTVGCSGNTKSIALLYAVYNYLKKHETYDIENLYVSTILFEQDDGDKYRDEFMRHICKSLNLKYRPVICSFTYKDTYHKKYLTYKFLNGIAKQEDVRWGLVANSIDDRIGYFFDNLNKIRNHLDNLIKDYRFSKYTSITLIRPFINIAYTKDLKDYLKEINITPYESNNEEDLNLNNLTKDDICHLISTIEDYNIFLNKASRDYTTRYLKEEKINNNNGYVLYVKPYLMNFKYRILLKSMIQRILNYKNEFRENVYISEIDHISRHISTEPLKDKKFIIGRTTVEYEKFNLKSKRSKILFYRKLQTKKGESK